MRKVVSQYNGTSWAVASDKRFVYDGWNLIEEQTLLPASSRFYVWGLDLSQSLQGAGGVGGLLATVSGTTTDHFLYDGNGNVGQLVNASGGAIDAQYEYDPYGNLTLSTGTLSASNPFRFSTKYLDAETGLYYYGYRYYDPKDGRWLSRDPIGERGGWNLYGFVFNNPHLFYDDTGRQVGPAESTAVALIPFIAELNPWVFAGTMIAVGTASYLASHPQTAGYINDAWWDAYENTSSFSKKTATELQLLAQAAISQVKAKIQELWKKNNNCVRTYPVIKRLTPAVYEHTVYAISSKHKPSVLTLDNADQKKVDTRRSTATYPFKKKFGPASPINNIRMQWDEYPYASTLEGGAGASAMQVPAWENELVQGQTLKLFYRLTKMKPGDKFKVVTIP